MRKISVVVGDIQKHFMLSDVFRKSCHLRDKEIMCTQNTLLPFPCYERATLLRYKCIVCLV